MRLQDILDSIRVYTTNEEKNFIKKFGSKVYLKNLEEHESYIAQKLLRKGIYEISNDNVYELQKVKNVFNQRSTS